MLYEIRSEEGNVLFNTMKMDALKLVTYGEDKGKACICVIHNGDILPIARGNVRDMDYEYEKLKTQLQKMFQGVLKCV